MRIPREKAEYLINSFITGWGNSKRKLVSIDAETFSELFFFLLPIHTIHDQETQNVILILVDRVKAIQICKDRYGLKTGAEVTAEVKEVRENI